MINIIEQLTEQINTASEQKNDLETMLKTDTDNFALKLSEQSMQHHIESLQKELIAVKYIAI